MATRLSESRVDHDGDPLPEGVYALVDPHGDVVSYKARWREHDENGVSRQRSKSFSPRAPARSTRRARRRSAQRDGAVEIVRAGDTVLRTDKAARLTFGELFKEWIAHHAAPNTGERYARDSVRTWDRHIEPRLGRVKLGALAERSRRHRALPRGPPAGRARDLGSPGVARATALGAALGTTPLPARRSSSTSPGCSRCRATSAGGSSAPPTRSRSSASSRRCSTGAHRDPARPAPRRGAGGRDGLHGRRAPVGVAAVGHLGGRAASARSSCRRSRTRWARSRRSRLGSRPGPASRCCCRTPTTA